MIDREDDTDSSRCMSFHKWKDLHQDPAEYLLRHPTSQFQLVAGQARPRVDVDDTSYANDPRDADGIGTAAFFRDHVFSQARIRP